MKFRCNISKTQQANFLLVVRTTTARPFWSTVTSYVSMLYGKLRMRHSNDCLVSARTQTGCNIYNKLHFHIINIVIILKNCPGFCLTGQFFYTHHGLGQWFLRFSLMKPFGTAAVGFLHARCPSCVNALNVAYKNPKKNNQGHEKIWTVPRGYIRIEQIKKESQRGNQLTRVFKPKFSGLESSKPGFRVCQWSTDGWRYGPDSSQARQVTRPSAYLFIIAKLLFMCKSVVCCMY